MFYNLLSKIFSFILIGITIIFVKNLISIFLVLRKLFIKKNFYKKNILFLEVLPVDNSGYQYRAKKWVEIFRTEGFSADVKTLINSRKRFDKNVRKGTFTKFFIFSIIKRFYHCLISLKYEIVIVRRELLLFNDYGNLFMEKFLIKIHPNVIHDFDDDIAAAKNNPRKITSLYGKLLLEDGNKFNNSLRLYKKFIVASEYLKQRVLQENPNLPPENICVIPTCVDYDKYPPKQYPDKIEKITFGWIGGDHNYPLLDILIPILNNLAEKYTFKLLVIGGREYKPDANFEVEFIKWTLESEIESLYKIDVGLMPLIDNNVSRGKGGFKLIQYMGLGIVSIASNVTINCEIIEHGKNSFLASTEEDWFLILSEILDNKYDLKQISKEARIRIINKFSFVANKQKYIQFLMKK